MGTVGNGEAMRIIDDGSRNEKAWVGFDGHMFTHEEFVRVDTLLKEN